MLSKKSRSSFKQLKAWRFFRVIIYKYKILSDGMTEMAGTTARDDAH